MVEEVSGITFYNVFFRQGFVICFIFINTYEIKKKIETSKLLD